MAAPTLTPGLLPETLATSFPATPRVIVVSKHGAGGMIGGNYIFKAKPDGFHMGVFTGVNVPASIITPGAEFDLRPGIGMRPVAGWQMALGIWYVLGDVPYETIWDAVGKGSDPNASMLTVNSTPEMQRHHAEAPVYQGGP